MEKFINFTKSNFTSAATMRKDSKTRDLTAQQLAFLDEERRKHFNGESKSYSWDEVKNLIRKKRVSNDAVEDWDETGIAQANAGNTKPVEEVIARLRQKYGLNSKEN